MASKLLLLYIFIAPFFGKSLNYSESIIFYSVPLIVLMFLFVKKQKIYLSKKTIIAELILIFLYLISSIFSKNIGDSYYQFFVFLNTIFVLSIAVNIIKPNDFLFYLVVASFGYSIVFLLNKFGIFSLDKDIVGDNFIPQIWGHSYISEFIVISIPILLKYFFSAKNKNKIIISSVFVVILASLFLSNSRSAIFSLIISLMFLKTKLKINNKLKISLIFISTLCLFFSFYLINTGTQEKKSYSGDRFEYWQQAIKGFKESPIIGNGPNTFSYINKKFQTDNIVSTTFAHSSLFTFLSENGLFFTAIFFFLIIKSLIKTSKINNTFFVCGLIALIYSLIDFSWNSPGIFIISLYFIFYYEIFELKKSAKFSNLYTIILAILLIIFISSKTLSDIFFANGQYKNSLMADRFNLNSYLEIIKSTNNLSTSLKFYNNEILLYTTIIDAVPSSQKEFYYQKIIYLNPANIDNYLHLISYYKQNNLDEKIVSVFQQISKNILISKLLGYQKANLSKEYYHYAIKIYSQNPEASIPFFEKTVEIMPSSGYFQVDLANAYWNTNQIKKAFNQLENVCQQYSDPKKQCQEYLQEHQESSFNNPGKKDFIDYIDNLSY